MTRPPEASEKRTQEILDNLQLDQSYRIDLQKEGWFGDFFAIRWDDIRHLTAAIASLSSEVTERVPSEFELIPYLVGRGVGATAGIYVVHVGQIPLSEEVREVRADAVRTFLLTISGDRSLFTEELPFSKVLNATHITKVDHASSIFLDKRAGTQKLSVPIITSIAEVNERFTLSALTKRTIETTASEREVVIGFIEGLDRDSRTCKIITRDRQRITVQFNIETHLTAIRNMLCDDLPHRVEISTVRDAKGRSGKIITDLLEDLPEEPLELSLSPSTKTK